MIALSLTAESIGIDSENYLFAKLPEYRAELPNLISRRQFNDRRKQTAGLCNRIREKIAGNINGGEEFFCIDSKPIEVCCKAVHALYGLPYPNYKFLCTCRASHRTFGRELPNHQLQTVAARCGFSLENHHHAQADAEVCAAIASQIL